MTAFALDSTVEVRPYVQRRDGQETIIGDPDRKVFLAIPTEGMEILEGLAAGSTVAECARRYEEKHQETPDIDAFLDILAAEGFLARSDADGRPAEPTHAHSHGPARGRGLSMNWISPRIAAWLSGGPALLVYLAIAVLGIGLYASDPSVMPGPHALLFQGGNFALLLGITFLLAVAGTLVHESAHAVVARALGTPVTLNLGNLLYVLVAQTDITGIQMASKPRRFLAVMAGTIADLVCASLLFAVMYADQKGIVTLPGQGFLLVAGVFYTFLLRMMAQLFCYVRTDVYYLYATAFSCRSLMTDTETLLKNLFRRVSGRPVVDQSHIASRERWAIRGYSVIYVFGRLFAFVMLFTFIIPIMAGTIYQFSQYIQGKPAQLGFIDFFAVGALTLLIYGAGLYLWGRNLRRGYVRRAAARRAVQPVG